MPNIFSRDKKAETYIVQTSNELQKVLDSPHSGMVFVESVIGKYDAPIDLILAGTDFFTVEVLTLKGLITYYVLFFIQLETRRVCLAGITPYPEQPWMEQQARNVTMKDWGFLAQSRYLLHDRDGKFCPLFRAVIKAGKVRPLQSPARSPDLPKCSGVRPCSPLFIRARRLSPSIGRRLCHRDFGGPEHLNEMPAKWFSFSHRRQHPQCLA